MGNLPDGFLLKGSAVVRSSLAFCGLASKHPHLLLLAVSTRVPSPWAVGFQSLPQYRLPPLPLPLPVAVVAVPPGGGVGVVAGCILKSSRRRRAAGCFSGHTRVGQDRVSWRGIDSSLRSTPRFFGIASSNTIFWAWHLARRLITMSTLYSLQVECKRYKLLHVKTCPVGAGDSAT